MKRKDVDILESSRPIVVVMKHGVCGTRLRKGTHRVPFCPKCKVAIEPGKPLPNMTLCCDECREPLAVTANGGSYCVTCGVYPGLQGAFLKHMA